MLKRRFLDYYAQNIEKNSVFKLILESNQILSHRSKSKTKSYQQKIIAFRIEKLYNGECESRCPIASCPLYYNPVCTSDGNTYPNRCIMRGANCNLRNAPAPLEQRNLAFCKQVWLKYLFHISIHYNYLLD